MKREKTRGIPARMKRLEARVRSVVRRVNTFATSASDSDAELAEKIDKVSTEVTKLKHRVTSIDLWRHKLAGKKPDHEG